MDLALRLPPTAHPDYLATHLPVIVRSAPKLRRLSLTSHHHVADELCAALASCEQLHELELLGGGSSLPGALSALTQLRSLDAEYGAEDELDQVAQLTKLTSLRFAISPDSNMEDRRKPLLRGLEALPRLQHLALDGVRLGGGRLAPLTALTHLSLASGVAPWRPELEGQAAHGEAGDDAGGDGGGEDEDEAGGQDAGAGAPPTPVPLPPGLRELLLKQASPQVVLALRSIPERCAVSAGLAFGSRDYQGLSSQHCIRPASADAMWRAACALEGSLTGGSLAVSAAFRGSYPGYHVPWIVPLRQLGLRCLRIEELDMAANDMRAVAQWLPTLEELALVYCSIRVGSLGFLRFLS